MILLRHTPFHGLTLVLRSVCLSLLAGCAASGPVPEPPPSPPPAFAEPRAAAFFEQAVQADLDGDEGMALAFYRQAAESPDADPELYGRLTARLLQAGRTEEALEIGRQYARSFPEDPEGPHLLALLLRLARQPNEAAAIALDGADRFPNHAGLCLEAAVGLIATANTETAKRRLTGFIATQPDAPAELYALLIQLRMEQEEPHPATIEQLLRTALEQHPNDRSLPALEASFYLQQENREAATAALLRLAGMHRTDSDVMQRVVLLLLQNGASEAALETSAEAAEAGLVDAPSLFMAVMQYAHAENQPELALEASRRGLAYFADNHELRFMTGALFNLLDRYAEAVAPLEKARELVYSRQPDVFDPRIEIQYGIALQFSGCHKEALAVFTQIVEQEYDDTLLQYLLFVQGRNDLEKIAAAEGLLEHLVQQVPEALFAAYYLAALRIEAGRYAEALPLFQQAEAGTGRTTQTQRLINALFYFQFGSTAERTGALQEAERCFRKALELEPGHPASANYLAYMWAEKGLHLDEGLELVQQALKAEPENGAYLDTRGWIYYMQGRYEEAMADLLAAAEKEPDDPTVLDHLGDCALKLERLDDALFFWKKSTEIKPDPAVELKIKSAEK